MTVCSMTQCWPCAASARRSLPPPSSAALQTGMAPPGLRRNCAGGIQSRRRSHCLSRTAKAGERRRPRPHGVAAARRLQHGSLRAGHRKRHVRLRHRQMGARKVQELRHRRSHHRRPIDGRDRPGWPARPGPRSQLCADRARRLGHAEVAERRRKSHAQRACDDQLSLVGCYPASERRRPSIHGKAAACSTTRASISAPRCPALPN